MRHPATPDSRSRLQSIRVLGRVVDSGGVGLHSWPALAIVAAIALSGCAPDRPEPRSGPEPESIKRDAVSEPGLEVVSWISTADDRTLAQTLAPHVALVPGMDRRSVTLWAANGLRLVALSPEDAATVQAAFAAGAGSSNTQWLGQAFDWTPLVTGPALASSTLIATDADRLRLREGALRILVRCWLAPVAAFAGADDSSTAHGSGGGAGGAVLRIELVPQHREAPDPANALISRTSIAATDDGLVFSRLIASIAARPGTEYLLVAEDPNVDWNDPQPTGDVGPRPLTIGEAMLLGGPTKAREAEGPQIPARSRMLVLLRPRVPESFSLSAEPVTAPAKRKPE